MEVILDTRGSLYYFPSLFQFLVGHLKNHRRSDISGCDGVERLADGGHPRHDLHEAVGVLVDAPERPMCSLRNALEEVLECIRIDSRQRLVSGLFRRLLRMCSSLQVQLAGLEDATSPQKDWPSLFGGPALRRLAPVQPGLQGAMVLIFGLIYCKRFDGLSKLKKTEKGNYLNIV